VFLFCAGEVAGAFEGACFIVEDGGLEEARIVEGFEGNHVEVSRSSFCGLVNVWMLSKDKRSRDARFGI
jgi:hypothetical protein